MMWTITMNMPTKNSPVHQVFVEHPAKTIEELTKLLSSSDFVVATEFHLYKEGTKTRLDNRGPIALNHLFIGKIKEFEER